MLTAQRRRPAVVLASSVRLSVPWLAMLLETAASAAPP